MQGCGCWPPGPPRSSSGRPWSRPDRLAAEAAGLGPRRNRRRQRSWSLTWRAWSATGSTPTVALAAKVAPGGARRLVVRGGDHDHGAPGRAAGSCTGTPSPRSLPGTPPVTGDRSDRVRLVVAAVVVRGATRMATMPMIRSKESKRAADAGPQPRSLALAALMCLILGGLGGLLAASVGR